MARTQLNINIDPALLSRLKSESIKSGKTLSNFLTELISNSLDGNEYIYSHMDLSRIQSMENKIFELERKISDLSLRKQKMTPFTDPESKNCSEFMRELFSRKIKNDGLSKKQGFDLLIDHISCFHQWNKLYSLRFKEILFSSAFII